MDWAEIAKKCNTTPGAASKRYSRMKQAFENGTSAPTTSSKSQSATGDQGSSKILSKDTVKIPRKSKATTPGIKQEDYSGEDADISGNANIFSETSSKRKRTTAKKSKVEDEDNEKSKPDEDDLDSESEYGAKNQAKRAKGSGGPVKPRATPKPKTKTMSAPKVALKATATVDPEPKETFLDDSDGPALPVHLNISNGNLLTSSVNPTEATTLITTEPSGNDLVAPVESGDDWEEGDEEVFYDTNEFVEEMEIQESECQHEQCDLCDCRANWVTNQLGLGVQNWLEEMGEV